MDGGVVSTVGAFASEAEKRERLWVARQEREESEKRIFERKVEGLKKQAFGLGMCSSEPFITELFALSGALTTVLVVLWFVPFATIRGYDYAVRYRLSLERKKSLLKATMEEERDLRYLTNRAVEDHLRRVSEQELLQARLEMTRGLPISITGQDRNSFLHPQGPTSPSSSSVDTLSRLTRSKRETHDLSHLDVELGIPEEETKLKEQLAAEASSVARGQIAEALSNAKVRQVKREEVEMRRQERLKEKK